MTLRILSNGSLKLILISLLGIATADLTGLISNARYSFIELILSYAFFILTSWAVYWGNKGLIRLIRKKYEARDQPFYKFLFSLLIANIGYSGILSFLLLNSWRLISKEAGQGLGASLNTSLIAIIAATFITNIYEIIFLNQEREYNLSRVEQLNIAKAQAELEALKNQIDPHFIFNSLNTLSFLITRDPANARLYNDTLAKVYRYILGNKERDLVLLREEVEFISNYFYLLKIRFSDAINMEIEINDLAAEDFLIPPISLQALVENAIKHNDFTNIDPLNIRVSIFSNQVIIKNTIHPKNFAAPTFKIGLHNLSNRYKLITNRTITIENNFNFFTVKLPILQFL